LNAIDTPGQPALLEAAHTEFLNYKDKIRIAVFVAANGWLVPTAAPGGNAQLSNIDGPYDASDYLSPNGQVLPSYEEAGRLAEREAFNEFRVFLHQCPHLRRVLFVINKAELFWPEADQVVRRYESGDWASLRRSAKWLHGTVLLSSRMWRLLPHRPGLPDPARNFPTQFTIDDQQRSELKRNLLQLLISRDARP
jgi:hypothetical protein